MPHKRDSNYHEGLTLSEPAYVPATIWTLFPPNTQTLNLFLLLSISMWKFISMQLMGQGLVSGHWSLMF